MKKILYSVMALAIATFAFTACEDVPEPYPTPQVEKKTINYEGQGTLESPYTVADAILYAKSFGQAESDKQVYIKGFITKITESYTTNFGNGTFEISDSKDGDNKFTFYRGLYLGNKKFASGNTQIQVGDEVIICGNVVNFKGNTPETAQGKAYLYSLNGKTESESTPTPPAPDGKGTAEAPYSVTEAIAAGSGTGVYVKAYIVGSVSGQVLAEGAHFSADGDSQSNLLIAATVDETDISKCMPVQLPAGDVRTALNLVDNKGNYKKEVTLYGNIERYFGATGLKSVTFAILDGNEIGTNPGGGGETPSSEVNTVSVADFIAAAESNDVWYQLTGTVKNLKDNDQYGNFDLEDATGSVYVYGVLSEKGGEKKKFQELVAAKGIKEGSTITIIGNRGSYNGKIEVVNAYFVSVSN